MARKLKVFQTSIGFFDLAVATSSMKAAAQAWGSGTDIFKLGFAKQTDDPSVVAAATAAPGVVLRRPVGSREKFTENPALPKASGAGGSSSQNPVPGRRVANKLDTKSSNAEQKAAKAREKENKRKARDRAKAEAERERAKRRRERAIATAKAAFEKARIRHEQALASIRKRQRRLEQEEADEMEKWEREKQAHDALARA